MNIKKCSVTEFLNETKVMINNESPYVWVYRGIDIKYPCNTSFSFHINQLVGNPPDLKKIKVLTEHLGRWHSNLIKELYKYISKENLDKTVWQYVQHVANRTNLLDVTISPEIAMAFGSNFYKKNTFKVIAFKVFPEMNDNKQSEGKEGFLVSLYDPQNHVFEVPPKIDSPWTEINKRIKQQHAAFLYCNKHYDLGNVFDIDENLKSDNMFDFVKYYEKKIRDDYPALEDKKDLVRVFHIEAATGWGSFRYEKDELLPKVEEVINLSVKEIVENAFKELKRLIEKN